LVTTINELDLGHLPNTYRALAHPHPLARLRPQHPLLVLCDRVTLLAPPRVLGVAGGEASARRAVSGVRVLAGGFGGNDPMPGMREP
jgi:hypothetical protein